MRDRDSQLIFESYKNRILVNEQATALALPAVEALGVPNLFAETSKNISAV